MKNLSFGNMNTSLPSADIDAAIIGRLPFLENDQKAAVLSVIEAFAPVPDANHWDDPAFAAEMDRRLADYENDKANCVTFDDVPKAMAHLLQDVQK